MSEIEYLKRIRLLTNNPQFAELEYHQVSKSFVYWLEHYVFTLDTHDTEHPFKRFPVYEYIRRIASIIGRSPIFLIPKSRQIMISWFFCAWCLHQVLYHEGRDMAFLSKRKEDADAMLLERMNIMYSRLPDELLPKHKNGKTAIRFFRGGAGKNARILNEKLNSQVIAYPAGADKVRSRTFYAIIMDEMAFIEKAEETITAAIPTVKGGGMIIGVSTANKDSFFLDMINLAVNNVFDDKSDHHRKKVLTWDGMRDLAKDFECFDNKDEGIIEYHSDDQDIDILWIHYTSHKDRKTDEWMHNAKKGYKPSAWEQEMEIDFQVVIGDQVFGDHPLDVDIVEPFEIPSNWIRARALDPGGTRSQTACLWLAIDPMTMQWYFYREYYQVSMSVDVNKKKIMGLSIPDLLDGHNDSNGVYSFSIIDPQSTARDQNLGGMLYSIQHLYSEALMVTIGNNRYNAGMYFMPGKKKPVHGIKRARNMFHNGMIKIFRSCPNFIFELRTYIDAKGKIDQGFKPHCTNDHLIDCMLFLMQSIPYIDKTPEQKRPTIGYINSLIQKGRQPKDQFLGSEF